MSEQPAYSSNEHGLQHTAEHKPLKHNVNHQFHHILKSDAQRRLSAPLHKRLSLLSSPCSVEAKCKILASGFSKFSCQNDQNRHTTMSFRNLFCPNFTKKLVLDFSTGSCLHECTWWLVPSQPCRSFFPIFCVGHEPTRWWRAWSRPRRGISSNESISSHYWWRNYSFPSSRRRCARRVHL